MWVRERIRRIQAVVRKSHGSEERSQMKPSVRQLAKKASHELNQRSAIWGLVLVHRLLVAGLHCCKSTEIQSKLLEDRMAVWQSNLMSVECGHLKRAFIYSISIFHFVCLFLSFYFTSNSFLLYIFKTVCPQQIGSHWKLMFPFLFFHTLRNSGSSPQMAFQEGLCEGRVHDSRWEASSNIQGARISCEHLAGPGSSIPTHNTLNSLQTFLVPFLSSLPMLQPRRLG